MDIIENEISSYCGIFFTLMVSKTRFRAWFRYAITTLESRHLDTPRDITAVETRPVPTLFQARFWIRFYSLLVT